jgi:hypothetical protein
MSDETLRRSVALSVAEVFTRSRSGALSVVEVSKGSSHRK